MHHEKMIFIEKIFSKKLYLAGLSCLLILCSSSAHSALQKELDELQTLEIPISQEGLTRIAVKEDRIQNVYGVSGEYILEADEENGQIFIRPLTPEWTKGISLTLTTEKGKTQDLRLIPKAQLPEALILKANTDKDDNLKKERRLTAFLNQQEIEKLLQACRENSIPLGYKEAPLKLRSPHISKAQSLTLRIVRELKGDIFKGALLKGGPLRGLTYELKTTASKRVALREEEIAESGVLNSEDIIAIQFSTRNVAPGESAYAYIIAKTY